MHIKTKRIIIGVTGLLGVGKTTVARECKQYGYSHIDADRVYHNLLRENKQLQNKLVKAFGRSIKTNSGTISRKKLRNNVLTRQTSLRQLNAITHPFIIQHIKKMIKKTKNIVIDAALLYETNLHKLCDHIIIVKTNKKASMERALHQSTLSKKEITTMMEMRKTVTPKSKFYTVDNSGSFSNTKKQIKHILKKISI